MKKSLADIVSTLTGGPGKHIMFGLLVLCIMDCVQFIKGLLEYNIFMQYASAICKIGHILGYYA